MLVLLQVFFLFISSSLSSTPHPNSFTPGNVKEWLDNPHNMAMLWNLGKQILMGLPPPKNLGELESILTIAGQVLGQKLALLKALAGGDHPELSKKLEALGPNPHPGVL